MESQKLVIEAGSGMGHSAVVGANLLKNVLCNYLILVNEEEKKAKSSGGCYSWCWIVSGLFISSACGYEKLIH